MIQLIPQQKIDEAAKNLSINRGLIMSHTVHIAEKSFESGVQFALKEIEPLMVELLHWASINYTSMDGIHSKVGENSIDKWIDSKQLLKEFVNSKNKKNE